MHHQLVRRVHLRRDLAERVGLMVDVELCRAPTFRKRHAEDLRVDDVPPVGPEEPDVLVDRSPEERLEIVDLIDRVGGRDALGLHRLAHVVALEAARVPHARETAMELRSARLRDHVHVEAAHADLRRRAGGLDLDLLEAVVVEVEIVYWPAPPGQFMLRPLML
jgi:hypothetical protein